MRTMLIRAGLWVFLAGCTRNLPPPPTPGRVMPALPPHGPPSAGMGQVAIATVGDDPSLVEEVTGHVEGISATGDVVAGETYGTVCLRTPCVADLGLGSHDLRSTSLADSTHTGTPTITFGAEPSNYRYALGRSVDHTKRWILGLDALVFGGLGFGTSTIGFGLEIGRVQLEGLRRAPGGPDPVAVGCLVAGMIIGGALTTLGTYYVSRPAFDLQQGTGVQWAALGSLGGPPQTPGLSHEPAGSPQASVSEPVASPLGVYGFALVGPVLTEVRPATPASAAGLAPGDVILEIDHQVIGRDAGRILELLHVESATSHLIHLRRGETTLDVTMAVPAGGRPRP
jgi:hypothetical protein